MKERPILFSAPMVRAIIDGRKTQTRRIYKVRKHPDMMCEMAASELVRERQDVIERTCPYGQPGDRLWIKETWSVLRMYDDQKPSDMAPYYAGIVRYLADGYHSGKLRPSIFMPRWASRITLEITTVRVERLQDISEVDACAEGAPRALHSLDSTRLGAVATHRAGFEQLWKSINSPSSWDANPWVWVVEFNRLAGESI